MLPTLRSAVQTACAHSAPAGTDTADLVLVGDRHGDAGGQERTWRTHPTLGRDRFHHPVRGHDTAIAQFYQRNQSIGTASVSRPGDQGFSVLAIASRHTPWKTWCSSGRATTAPRASTTTAGMPSMVVAYTQEGDGRTAWTQTAGPHPPGAAGDAGAITASLVARFDIHSRSRGATSKSRFTGPAWPGL